MGDDIECKGRRSLDRARLRRGFFLAVAISAATLVVISLLTLDRGTFSALSRLSPGFLVLAAVIYLGRWIWSALRMQILIASTGKSVPFGKVVKTVYSGFFLGLITPWRAGGVCEIFFLYEYGLEVGEATAVASFATCISTLFVMLFFPFAIWIARSHIEISLSIQGFLFSALAIGLVYLALVIWAILSPHATVGKTLLNHSPSSLSRRDWYRRFLERLNREIQIFARSLRLMMGLKKHALAAVAAATILYWLSGFLAIPVVVVGLGYGSYFWQAVVAQMVVQMLMPFIPTPGGSGLGEVGFLFVYSSIFADKGIAGLLTLIWRFIEFYLGLVVGGAAFILVMRDIERSGRQPAQPLSDGVNEEESGAYLGDEPV